MKTDLQIKLENFFVYDPEGFLRYRYSNNRKQVAGEIAGTINTYGYRQLTYEGRGRIIAHFVWAYHNGVWPQFSIDHINHNKLDDRIENLRDIPIRENIKNTKERDLPRGVKKNRNKFTARLKVNGREINLGTYDTPEEAGKVYEEASPRAYEIYAKLF